jgi:hypothetical protein
MTWHEGVQGTENIWWTAEMWQGRLLSCGYYDKDRNPEISDHK